MTPYEAQTNPELVYEANLHDTEYTFSTNRCAVCPYKEMQIFIKTDGNRLENCLVNRLTQTQRSNQLTDLLRVQFK